MMSAQAFRFSLKPERSVEDSPFDVTTPTKSPLWPGLENTKVTRSDFRVSPDGEKFLAFHNSFVGVYSKPIFMSASPLDFHSCRSHGVLETERNSHPNHYEVVLKCYNSLLTIQARHG